MLRIGKLTDYSIVVLTHMAEQPGRLYSAGQIASEVGIAQPTVSKILKALGRAGLVRSYRGASGGYRLARAPTEVPVTEVIEAMEGPVGITECTTAQGVCAQEPICSIRGNWQRINQAVVAALSSVSLADMTRPAAAQAGALQWQQPPAFKPADTVS